MNNPVSLIICLVVTPAILAKLEDYLATECELEGMMIYDPGLVYKRTAARLAMDAVKKKTPPSLLNNFAILS